MITTGQQARNNHQQERGWEVVLGSSCTVPQEEATYKEGQVRQGSIERFGSGV